MKRRRDYALQFSRVEAGETVLNPSNCGCAANWGHSPEFNLDSPPERQSLSAHRAEQPSKPSNGAQTQDGGLPEKL
jgi:hypothetical protein